MKRILIVEDNPETVHFYQQALQPEYTLLFANSVNVAKQLFQEAPDLVILDVMLPGGRNGFDLLQDMKKDERLKKIPVIILTSLDSEEKTAREIGADDYILKTDISFDQLLERVKKLLGK